MRFSIIALIRALIPHDVITQVVHAITRHALDLSVRKLANNVPFMIGHSKRRSLSYTATRKTVHTYARRMQTTAAIVARSMDNNPEVSDQYMTAVGRRD
jgi:hypothetical protein